METLVKPTSTGHRAAVRRLAGELAAEGYELWHSPGGRERWLVVSPERSAFRFRSVSEIEDWRDSAPLRRGC